MTKFAARAARIAVAMAALVGAVAIVALCVQRRILFPRPSVANAPERPADATLVSLHTEAGDVEAWYLAPLGNGQRPAPVLIAFHGNAELIDDEPPEFEAPRHWGVGVLLVEYPGYGRSAGSPSESSITATVLAAADWVKTQPQLDPKRVIAFGRSLGGGAACVLAAQRPTAALILESSFTGVRALAARFHVPGFLMLDPFDNLSVVKSYTGPTLVIHGEQDAIVPVSDGKQLAAAAHHGELVLLPCGHNDCVRPWEHIREFLARNRLLPLAAP